MPKMLFPPHQAMSPSLLSSEILTYRRNIYTTRLTRDGSEEWRHQHGEGRWDEEVISICGLFMLPFCTLLLIWWTWQEVNTSREVISNLWDKGWPLGGLGFGEWVQQCLEGPWKKWKWQNCGREEGLGAFHLGRGELSLWQALRNLVRCRAGVRAFENQDEVCFFLHSGT